MLIRDYTSLSEKKRMQTAYINELAQRSELENLYGRANARRELEMPINLEIPKKPSRPKQSYSISEIKDELAQKLEPFFVNIEELLKFLTYLDSTNQVVLFDDNLFQFERRYIQGQKRNTSTQMKSQWNAFKQKFQKDLVVEKEKVEMIDQDLKKPQQKLLADIRMNPLGATQLEGLSVQSNPTVFGEDLKSQLIQSKGRLRKTQRKIPVLNEKLPEEDDASIESVSRSVADLQGILGPKIKSSLERPITNELNVKELKSILKSNGLAVSGVKNDLIQRLLANGIRTYMPSEVQTVSGMRKKVDEIKRDDEPMSLETIEDKLRNLDLSGAGIKYIPKNKRLSISQFGRGIKNRRTKRVLLNGILKAGNDNIDIMNAFKDRF